MDVARIECAEYPTVQPDRAGVLPQNPINRVRVHVAARLLHLAISA